MLEQLNKAARSLAIAYRVMRVRTGDASRLLNARMLQREEVNKNVAICILHAKI